MQTNIVINATASGKKIATTITYVNPQATNAKLLALARKLNSLTSNDFISATKETKGEFL